MKRQLINEIGKIDISADVISAIAGQAALECSGLAGLTSNTFAQKFLGLFSKNNSSQGVEIFAIGDGSIKINIHIAVNYGVKVSEVAKDVMERVKRIVEQTTGIFVEKVNVFIQGVNAEDEI